MKIIVTESQSSFLRRYQEIKGCVKSDYEYLLRQDYFPENAKEITIDHTPFSYLDDFDKHGIRFTEKNLKGLRKFIEDNFEDLIS
jgi:hypothetical protein